MAARIAAEMTARASSEAGSGGKAGGGFANRDERSDGGGGPAGLGSAEADTAVKMAVVAASLKNASSSSSFPASAITSESSPSKAFDPPDDGGGGDVLHRPPEGFHLSAHVVTDPSDGLSYFVDTGDIEGQQGTSDRDLLVPFLWCGAVGSTTERFRVKSGYFRHFPAGSSPSSWTTTAGDRPELVVALHPLEVIVSGNGEEARMFVSGDVILLQDTTGRGHKMRAARGEKRPGGEVVAPSRGKSAAAAEERDLSVFVMTLPNYRHGHRRSPEPPPHDKNPAIRSQGTAGHLSILGLRRASQVTDGGRGGWGRPHPCTVEHDPAYSTLGLKATREQLLSSAAQSNNPLIPPLLSALGLESPRRIVLFATGLAVSSFVTYFAYRVAPPVLGLLGIASAVAGGTIAVDAALGEMMAAWAERGGAITSVRPPTRGSVSSVDIFGGITAPPSAARIHPVARFPPAPLCPRGHHFSQSRVNRDSPPRSC